MIYLDYTPHEQNLILDGRREEATQSYRGRKDQIIEDTRTRRVINKYDLVSEEDDFLAQPLIEKVSWRDFGWEARHNLKDWRKGDVTRNLNHNSTKARMQHQVGRKLKQAQRRLEQC